MTITLQYPVDEIKLAVWIAAGWTHLTLWYADQPDGVYTNASATVAPTTLALMSSTPDYVSELTYTSGSYGQWFKVRLYDGVNYSPLNQSKPIHGGGGTTLKALRQQLGVIVNDMVVATTTAAGSSSAATILHRDIVRRADDHFNGQFFNDVTQGDWGLVSDFTQATGVFAFSPVLTGSVADASEIEITRRWTPDQYRDAINDAVHEAYPVLMRNVVNTSVRTVNQVYGYQVPGDIKKASQVEVERLTNQTSTDAESFGMPWDNFPFRRKTRGLQNWIELKSNPPADRRLRITGEGPLSEAYNDTDSIEIVGPQAKLLCYLGAAYLYRLLANDAASSDTDRYEEMAKYYELKFERNKGKHGAPRPHTIVWNDQNMLTGYRGNRDLGYWDTSS